MATSLSFRGILRKCCGLMARFAAAVQNGSNAGRFVWPQAASGGVSLTSAQLSMLLEGIDLAMPALRTVDLAA